MSKIREKFIELKQGVSEFLRKTIEKMRRYLVYANLTVIIGLAGVLLGVLGIFIGLIATVLQSDGTNILVTESVDSSTHAIVYAIESSGEELKETIKTSNKALGASIKASNVASNEVLGTRIVNAIENLGSILEQNGEDSNYSHLDRFEGKNTEFDNEKVDDSLNESELYDLILGLMNGSNTGRISKKGRKARNTVFN